MKRLAVLAMIAMMAMPVYAVDLDSMTVDELISLEQDVHRRIADNGEYPYRSSQYRYDTEYHVGDTWEVPDLFKITINSVERVDERDEDDDHDPVAVYDINYTYENINNTLHGDGFSVDVGGISPDVSVIDSDGELGYSYGGYFWRNNAIPEDIPIGARFTTSYAIGLNHDGQFKLVFDINGNKAEDHIATFVIDPE